MVERPVYLLAGTEQFLKEEALAKIKSAFLAKESADFNFHTFDACASSARDILECATTLPFLGKKRLVLVRGVEHFSAAEQVPILSYIRHPSKYTLLILETQEVNLAQNFFAEVCKYARVIICHPLKDNQLFSWLRQRISSRDKQIEEEALRLLIHNTGTSLELLDNALENLLLYVGERKRIELNDVRVLVGPDISAHALELFSAIIVKDRERSLQILDGLCQEGVNSAQILGALAHKIISARKQINSSNFAQSLRALQQTDMDIKSGRQPPRLALELMLVRLLHLF